MTRWLVFFCIIAAVNSLNCPKECHCDEKSRNATCSNLELEANPSKIVNLKIVNPSKPINLTAEYFQNFLLLTELIIENGTIDYINETAFIDSKIESLIIRNSVFLNKIPNDLFKTLFKVDLSYSTLQNFVGIKSNTLHQLNLEGCKLTSFEEKDCPHLHKLILRNNLIEEITLNNPISIVDFSHNKIKTFIVNVPLEKSDDYEAESVDLSYNPLQNVQPSNLYVEHLNLEACNLNNIDFLKNISSIDQLNLKNNNIKQIPANLFKHLDLKRLDLSDNNLLSLPENVINESQNLDILILDNNLIETFSLFNAQDALPFTLSLLSCDNCNLKYLKESALDQFSLLDTLILSNNNIKAIPKNLFSSLKKLKQLDLSTNLIHDLDNETFSKNIQLKKLNLSKNYLKTISADTFKLNNNLEVLDISNCNITNLWEGTKAIILNLKELDAENNHIKKVTIAELNVMNKIQVLKLNNNPLDYDSDMFEDMCIWLKQHKLNIEKQDASQKWMDQCQDINYDLDDNQYNYDDYDKDSEKEDPTLIEYEIPKDTKIDESFNMDAKHVIAIDSKFRKKISEQRSNSEFVFFLLPTLVFVLTALIVLILTVSVILCVLQNKNKTRSNAPQIKILPWSTSIKNKKHSGLVYRPLSEEKIPV